MSACTLTEMDRLIALDDAERTFQMDEETFRLFYQQTARPLWSYLARITGDRRHADDLLQETYYRFLRASATFESDEHRQRYLFRIATNLSRDFRRRADTRAVTVSVGIAEFDPAELVAGLAGRVGVLHAVAPADLGREQLGRLLDPLIQELAELLRVVHGPLVLRLRAGDADRLVPPWGWGCAFGRRHDGLPADDLQG